MSKPRANPQIIGFQQLHQNIVSERHGCFPCDGNLENDKHVEQKLLGDQSAVEIRMNPFNRVPVQ